MNRVKFLIEISIGEEAIFALAQISRSFESFSRLNGRRETDGLGQSVKSKTLLGPWTKSGDSA